MLLKAGFTSLKKDALAPGSGDSRCWVFFPSISLALETAPSFFVYLLPFSCGFFTYSGEKVKQVHLAMNYKAVG